ESAPSILPSVVQFYLTTYTTVSMAITASSPSVELVELSQDRSEKEKKYKIIPVKRYIRLMMGLYFGEEAIKVKLNVDKNLR
ncbi:hypothetical protein Q0590_32430, partial [Rhodocytophaga aerolata]